MQVEIIRNQKTERHQAEPNSNLMDFLVHHGILLNSDCAGRGTCGKCGVKILSGQLSTVTAVELKHFSQEELDEGWVLSCQRLIKEDIVLEIPKIEDAVNRKIELQNFSQERFTDPNLEKFFVTLKKPDLHDQLPDLERLLQQVEDIKKTGVKREAPLGVLNKLPELLRSSSYEVTAVLMDNALIAVEPGDTRESQYGFVFDIGTTTIAVYLVCLKTGKVISAGGETNPQASFGADVVTRISVVSEDFNNLKKLNDLVVETMANLMKELLHENSIEEKYVYHIAVVGNTTMSHLFLQADPRNLVKAPFIPCFKGRMTVQGKEMGFPMHPEGEIVVLPNIAGYVGSDTMGVMLATKIYDQEGYSLAVDIGTNGEIVLAGDGKILTCSTAAGPAFEGAQIHDGMRAGDGAIEKVSIKNGKVQLKVIGDMAPKGICGSGIIDAIAALYKANLMNFKGQLLDSSKLEGSVDENLKQRMRRNDNIWEFVLAFKGEYGNERDIIISQKDIRELQLAKGAIAAGIKVLAEDLGISTAQIDRVFLAGAFGNYIDQKNAVLLGMFPGIDVQKIIPVGNAAGEGAKMALLSKKQRELADHLSDNVHHVELSSSDAFYTSFMKEMIFPKKEVGQEVVK
ncbi:ASKHA domain-containing protein [Dehalobacterium formicoaceticum]|uniref:ASKHA domain-containing protein n=1 Tax=Dehalobacterium formicoaceticum TaxID=51515 RepID=UPI0018E0450D|nr:ASKHA domain-containing protein [Dehalobacterium formicoaceticum]